MPKRYSKTILEASEILSKRLLESPEDIISAGLTVDKVVLDIAREVGRVVTEQVFCSMSSLLKTRLVGQGMSVEREPSVVFKTLLGDVELPSPYLRNDRGESCRPMKSVFGIEGGRWSLSVERAMVDFGIEKSFDRAARTFEEHYGRSVGRTTVRKRTMQAGKDADRYLSERFSQDGSNQGKLPAAVEVMIAELDGCAIRTGVLENAPEQSLGGDSQPKKVRVEQWREVRTGLVRPLGAAQPSYVCRMDSYDELGRQLSALARERGWTDDTQVVAPGDGGNGLRDAMEVAFPKIQFILDPYHLKDNFYSTAEALGYSREERTLWVKGHMDRIWKGQVDDVLADLYILQMAFDEDHERLGQLIGYLKRFADAVDYPNYKERGWPVGSGEIESAHRHVPQERMKLPGAWWHPDNVNPILALRVIRANGWWEDFCAWTVQQRTQQRQIPEATY